MKKIPCIKCTEKLWEYIEPYLSKWEYSIKSLENCDYESWHNFPYLIINDGNRLGICDNHTILVTNCHNRELIYDVEEFLKRAAELKGFTYRREETMEINGIEIKPGMVIEIQEENKEKINYVVFPLLNGELGVISYEKNSWDSIKTFIKYNSSKIIYIRDLTSVSRGGIGGGEILWKKPEEVILTMDEIAEKFGYPVESIKIKK